MAKKSGLGKGLGALMPNYDLQQVEEASVLQLKLTQVEPNKNQPRKQFDEEKLQALADSVKTHGVIQPILVVKKDDGYQIVAGERRWRAAKKAGLKELPAIVCDYDLEKSMEVALIENLQREDLNPVEEALGYQSLMQRFSLTQEKISERVGKSRSAVANSLRLLKLPDEVIKMLKVGELTGGHAKAILGLETAEQQIELAHLILTDDLSVREAERYIKRCNTVRPTALKQNDQIRYHLSQLESEIAKSIGTKVRIKHGSGKGKIEIEYYSNEDLERLMGLICR